MKFVRARLGADSPNSAGLSLIEVLVAMMIFAMVAMGIALALTSTLATMRDNKSREVASNLAAADIDEARSAGNPFDVKEVTRDVTVAAGDIYTIERKTYWDTAGGSSLTCGSAGGPLKYLRVTVKVTWTNMRSATAPVMMDTLLAPTTRINDETKGTIFVSVKNALGTGSAGVTFTATSSTGTVVTSTATNANGCSFILQVPPDTYTVKLNTPNYIDFQQITQPALTFPVAAGSSASFAFQYDKSARYDLTYASNRPSSGPAPKLPTNMDTTFISRSYGNWVVPVSSSRAFLHPYEGGYQAIAGKYAPRTELAVGCPSVDPEAWDPDTRVTPNLVGIRPIAKTALPGDNVGADVKMGLVSVASSSTNTDKFITAVSQTNNPVPGQPSCADTMTYAFGSVVPSSGSVTLALPFGSWKLYTSNSATSGKTFLPASRVALASPGLPGDATGLFVLDPRGITP